jgi:hypothetical protein
MACSLEERGLVAFDRQDGELLLRATQAGFAAHAKHLADYTHLPEKSTDLRGES